MFPVSISGFLIPFPFTSEPDYVLWEQCLKNAIITGLIEMYELDGPGWGPRDTLGLGWKAQ